jgi:hypothetical protein
LTGPECGGLLIAYSVATTLESPSACSRSRGLLGNMNTIEQRIERRTVIEAYIAYECGKKDLPLPTLNEWDWTSANAIDEQLKGSRLKSGILAGYKEWNKVGLTIQDLEQCAVYVGILRGQPRALGQIHKAALENWTPDRETTWYDAIARGQPLESSAPLILRPALTAEKPAQWYVEDGSERAVAFVKYARLFSPSNVVAIAYLGIVPDHDSTFMNKNPFNELLRPTA